jgi:small neutral amino acid transporter SnatA (MarC family)
MNSAQRNHQSLMASVYVFAIMMVAYYAGQVVMNTFGISIPGLRIAGGLIVAFIGFRMLFPPQKMHEAPEIKPNRKSWKTNRRPISLSCRWRCRALPGRGRLR